MSVPTIIEWQRLERARKRLHAIGLDLAYALGHNRLTDDYIELRIAKRRLEKAAMTFAKAAAPIYPKSRYTR